MKKLVIVAVLLVTSPVQAGVVCNGLGCRLEKVVTKTVEIKETIVGTWGSQHLVGPSFGSVGIFKGVQRRQARRAYRRAGFGSYGGYGSYGG